MAESHVISALTAKRSELAGIIFHHKKEISRIAEEVKTLDAAIKLFEPDYQVHAIKPKRFQRKNSFFEHGEANKLVLDIIRRGQPIAMSEIVAELATFKGVDVDSDVFPLFKDSVKSTLKRQKKQGLVVDDRKERGVHFWKII